MKSAPRAGYGEINLDPTPFVIFTMPLSLDAWLANWLRCQHCGLLTSTSLEAWFASLRVAPYGSVESSMPVVWRVLKQRIPEAKIVLVGQEIDSIKELYSELGQECNSALLFEQFEIFQAIANFPGVKVMEVPMDFPFQQLEALHKHLFPELPFDEEWTEECLAARIANPFIQPNIYDGKQSIPAAKVHIEALAEARRLGGNSHTLWLN